MNLFDLETRPEYFTDDPGELRRFIQDLRREMLQTVLRLCYSNGTLRITRAALEDIGPNAPYQLLTCTDFNTGDFTLECHPVMHMLEPTQED